jgi:hypothetical protein
MPGGGPGGGPKPSNCGRRTSRLDSPALVLLLEGWAPRTAWRGLDPFEASPAPTLAGRTIQITVRAKPNDSHLAIAVLLLI